MSPARKNDVPDEQESAADSVPDNAAEEETPEAAQAPAGDVSAEATDGTEAAVSAEATDGAEATDSAEAADGTEADEAAKDTVEAATEAVDEDGEVDEAAPDTETAEAPAKAPARQATRQQPAAKPKRTPAVASYSLVDADLPDDIFDARVNVPLIHQVVVAQQAAARQGTHSTKTRGDVRGGGKKPYRQKGTGRARQGSIRAPQFAGGGIVHGPVPRSYAQKTPKKMKAAALRGALSDRARHGLVQVVDGFVDGAEPKTRDALAVLNLATEGKVGQNVLVVAETSDQVTWKSLRNAIGVHLIDPGQLNTYDVLVSDRVVFTSAALAAFVARVGGASETHGREDAKL